MLGMIIGVSAVITLVALGSGAQALIEEQIKAGGTNMVTVMAGNAAMQAAERARELIAAAFPHPVVFAEGRVFDAADPSNGVTFAEAVARAEAMHGTIGTVGSYRPPKPDAKYKGGGVGPSPSYSYTAAVVEVEVDPRRAGCASRRSDRTRHRPRAQSAARTRTDRRRRLHGPGEALMEEQPMRRLPPRLLARTRARDAVDARLQEPPLSRCRRS
jgi:4-hydroxybenzoyl-CoA reductase subunit alpha